MAYPETADFTPRPDPLGPFGAWWRYAYEGASHVCATDGGTVLARARDALGLAPTPRSWNGELLAALRHDAATRAASAAGAERAAWQGLAAAIDPAARAPSRAAVLLAIWLGFYAPHGLRLDALELPASARLPTSADVFPGGDASVACFVAGRDPRPEELSDAELAAARERSRYGVRLGPGVARPTDARPPSAARGQRGPVGPLIFGVLLAAGAAVAFAVTRLPQWRESGESRVTTQASSRVVVARKRKQTGRRRARKGGR